jgi:hypothetical protein
MHIDIRYYFVRQCVDKGNSDINPMSTQNKLANIMTKALGKVRFIELWQQLGVIDVQHD